MLSRLEPFKYVDAYSKPKEYSDSRWPGSKRSVGPYDFVPFIKTGLSMIASVEILLLRPASPGNLLGRGGDIDNRVKTLIDSLRMPGAEELPDAVTPTPDEEPFYVLLEDDKLITKMSVDTDRLLEPNAQQGEVGLVIKVEPGFTNPIHTISCETVPLDTE